MDFDGEDDMGELPSAKQFANLNMAVESSLIHPLKMGALHSRYIYNIVMLCKCLPEGITFTIVNPIVNPLLNH